MIILMTISASTVRRIKHTKKNSTSQKIASNWASIDGVERSTTVNKINNRKFR